MRIEPMTRFTVRRPAFRIWLLAGAALASSAAWGQRTRLYAGEQLVAGTGNDKLFSSDAAHKFQLVVQKDGNLCIYQRNPGSGQYDRSSSWRCAFQDMNIQDFSWVNSSSNPIVFCLNGRGFWVGHRRGLSGKLKGDGYGVSLGAKLDLDQHQQWLELNPDSRGVPRVWFTYTDTEGEKVTTPLWPAH
jgi:hypothetical protein